MGILEAVQGDITTMRVDAIVNAANSALLGGGGVDGAIHRAAGPGLRTECATLGGCPTGEARITKGYRLPARCVIHTVGPIWHGGAQGEREALRRCYESCITLAREHDVRSIAFPSISTGAYGFPIDEASRIAVRAVRDSIQEPSGISLVRFVCFSAGDLALYQEILRPVTSP
jgi:O-acetyl-ADP-ribose deacetylase